MRKAKCKGNKERKLNDKREIANCENDRIVRFLRILRRKLVTALLQRMLLFSVLQ